MWNCYKSQQVAYFVVTLFKIWQVTNGGVKGLANLQRESMGETPRQQVEQLLRDGGFLMLCSVKAEALFLERTLIPLQNF